MAKERKYEDAAYATLASGEIGADADMPGSDRVRARELVPGDVVDRYVVEEVLGEGASAWVFRVRHETLGTHHALKLLKEPNEDMSARHLNEGKMLARWEHPHIVRVADAFAVSEGTALILELVDGPTLEEVLAEGPLELDVAEALFRQLVEAVGYAHERGVIHRDLKPSNVLMSQEGHAKISDFGIAKHTSFELTSDLLLTKTGHALGTPAYMSPEQVDASHQVDARADMFSLGVILFEMVCGVRPYTGRTVWELLAAMKRGERVSARALRSDLPEHLERAIDACLQADLGTRVPSAAALIGVLDGAAWVSDAPAAGASGGRRPPRRGFVLLASGMALVGSLASLGAMWSSREERARLEVEVDELARDGAQRLERERERLDLERRAWRASRHAPAEALALFRASASLAADPEVELARPEVLTLPARGGHTRVLPSAHQPMRIEASGEHDLIVASMLDGTLQTWRVSTGEPLLTIDTKHGDGRRRFNVNETFTRAAQEMPTGHGSLQTPRPLRVYDLQTGELVYTPSYGQQIKLTGFRKGGELVTFSSMRQADTPRLGRHLSVSFWEGMFGEFKSAIDLDGLAFSFINPTLSPDGREAVLIEVGTRDMWWVDLETGEADRVELDSGGALQVSDYTAEFASGGERLFTMVTGRVSVFDTKTRRLIESHSRRTGRLFDFAEGSALGVSGDFGSGVDIWALGLDEPVGEITPRRGSLMDARVLDGTGYVATASTESEVELWSPSGERAAAWPGHGTWVLSLEGVVDGARRWLISGGREHALHVRDARVLGELVARPAELVGARHVTWSEGGARAAGWSRGRLTVWDLEQGRVSHSFEGREPDAIMWGFDGADLYTYHRRTNNDSEWCRYDLAGGARAWCVETPRWKWRAQPVAEGVVYCDPVSCRLLSRDGVVHALEFGASDPLEERMNMVASNTMADGTFVFAGTTEKTWMFEDGLLGEPRLLDGRFQDIAVIEPVRGGAVFGGWDGALDRWEQVTRERVWRVELGAGVLAVDETADGTRLAVALMDHSVALLDASTGEVARTLTGPRKESTELAMSEDGAQVAATTKEGLTWVWSAHTGDVLAVWVAPPARGMLSFTEAGELERRGEFGALHRWPDARALAARSWMERFGEGTNLRVCRASGEVVPVTPYPMHETVWAPDSACRVTGGTPDAY